jgi:aromatic ring-opening dioxygenase catalytic subunit (LigB family)
MIRQEGILILSGGLTIHNLRDRASFDEATASPLHKQFDQALLDAVSTIDVRPRSRHSRFFLYVANFFLQPVARKQALIDLTEHPGFRSSHPREDHFIPVYIAAGAGESGDVKIIAGIYGAPTFAFGL